MNIQTFAGDSTNPTDRAGSGASSPGRVIGFIGNCQAKLIHRAFQRMTESVEIHSFYHFTELAPAEKEQALQELRHCDELLIQDIRNFEDYPLRDAIRAETRIIRFPVLWFAAPWPYDDFNGLRDSFARDQDDPSLHTVTYYDGALGRLRRSIPDPEQRLAAYRTLAINGLVSPQKVLDFETRRLEAQDAHFGSAIGKFILDTFHIRPVFHTVNRPCAEVLSLLFDSLLAALALDLPRPELPELDELGHLQVPIHPKVAEALDMRWVNEGRLYRVRGELMNWEDYMRAYIARYS